MIAPVTLRLRMRISDESGPVRPRRLDVGTLVGTLPNAERLEWVVGDGLEPLELSGGEDTAFAEVMTWYREGRRVPTSTLIRAFGEGYGLQIWWGELRGYSGEDSQLIWRISAFDSHRYEVAGATDLLSVVADRLCAFFDGEDEPPAIPT